MASGARRCVATGYDPGDPACPTFALLRAIARVWPGLTLSDAPPDDAEVMLVAIDRDAAPRIFRTPPSDTTMVVGLVLDAHRATLPLLKLCDRIVFTDDRQRRLVEELIGLRYDARVIPLPAGTSRPYHGTRSTAAGSPWSDARFEDLMRRRDPALIDWGLVPRPTRDAPTLAVFVERLRALALDGRDAVLAAKAARFAGVVPDTLADVDIVHGAPLDNDVVFSICFRDQASKIARCLASIARQNPAFDAGLVIVDDASTDGSLARVMAFLDAHPLPACVVRNRRQLRAARNFHNVVHLFTTRDDTVIAELDGDDSLVSDGVLERLAAAYAAGAGATRGSYRALPDGVVGADELFRQHALRDFREPWDLARCTPWLHLRTARRELLRRVERPYYCDRRTGTWLANRHDAAVAARVIELAGGRCTFIPEVLYGYDLSGDAHVLSGYTADEAHLRMFHDLDKLWPLVRLGT